MSNPLLQAHALPPFSDINAEHVLPAVEEHLNTNRTRISELLGKFASGEATPTWESLIEPMDEWHDELSKAWSPVGHLNGVLNSDELREAYNACLPLLSQYWTEFGQNEDLFKAYDALKNSPEFDNLSVPQKTAINNALRDFRLSGIDLPADKKARYAEIQQQLSKLTSKFSENVLDATAAWTKHITDASELDGVPESGLGLLAQQAQQRELDGYVITLDFPSYMPIMSYCTNRELREELYTAFVTRASDTGPNAGEFDNSQNMKDIMALRYELATLLGFDNYAEYSVATKMAESGQEVIDFLNDLAAKAKPQAEREFGELKAYAADELGMTDLKPWDVTFAAEKLRQARYSISQEDIRPYLPVNTVIKGMFEVVSRLYGIEFEEQNEFDTYHPDARFFHVTKDGKQIAAFYLDLYARSKKRGGAWMDDCRVRRSTKDGVQLPVAYLVCNFSPAVGDTPALLTHDEMTTLFHEFGHGLHHMMTEIDVSAVSGINGVAWDAVELPSQFMENWCYEPEALAFLSGHYQTGEPLPQELLDKLLDAKNFQSAMMTMRQLEFALFDFRLHREYSDSNPVTAEQILNEVREKVTVVPTVEFNRFQHSFSHIFAGGYAAGYYSYKWAEVLSADAYSRFEEEGIFNRDTGESFLKEILSQGGSREAAELFEAFRGRKPSVEPLLRHSGIEIPEVA
ncbi:MULTISPECIES: oligopeptidase A [Thalassolituus]|uniref:oligopeptidase A n=2 Tax=Oceanospirillaceae TaxID=135620 RepID=UPI000C5ED212|nr:MULTISPECIES: oligopeptidase A [Thalassolituus]MAX86330.1 oligopeptidase A [Oceanospirillaceae bacterium]MEE3191444.1 oligopeptidase A [Pseudomonadota bacterium]|tara:strand:+ start:24869 stop:26929 length:2061 start_codon:yes stop_codon:yes gene_type:complete